MKKVLHLRTREEDPIVQRIAQLQERPEVQVRVIDLTREFTDYDQILEAIFEADATVVW